MARPKNVRYIGDKKSKEVHRLQDGKAISADCQIDEITDEHRVEFKTLSEAMGQAFDKCARCWKVGSKR